MDKQSGDSAFDFTVNLAGFPHFNGHAWRLAAWPLEIWLQWQQEMLKAAAPAAAAWFERRREGTEVTLKALGQLTSCGDLKEAAALQREWVENETKRLEADAQALSGQVFSWSRETVRAAGHSVEAVPPAKLKAQREAAI